VLKSQQNQSYQYFLVVYKQGTKISKTIFGFMGLGGKDIVFNNGLLR